VRSVSNSSSSCTSRSVRVPFSTMTAAGGGSCGRPPCGPAVGGAAAGGPAGGDPAGGDPAGGGATGVAGVGFCGGSEAFALIPAIVSEPRGRAIASNGDPFLSLSPWAGKASKPGTGEGRGERESDETPMGRAYLYCNPLFFL
jgi:hypothetical protein